MKPLTFLFLLIVPLLLFSCGKNDDDPRSLIGTWEYADSNATILWTFKDSVNMNIKISSQQAVTQAQYKYRRDSLLVYGVGVGNSYALLFSANDAFMASYSVQGYAYDMFFVRKE